MTIRGVIFDLGHTLIYLDSTWPEVFKRGVRDLAHFLAFERPEIDGKAFGQTLLYRRAEGFVRAEETLREVTAEESMRWTLAQFGEPNPKPELVTGALRVFFEYEETCWLTYPEAAPMLLELEGMGLRLGAYSNATSDELMQLLVDEAGLRHWLNPVLTSAGTGIRKPDPAAFAPILAEWGLPPDEVVMVGDTLGADILGAGRAGMRSVYYPSRPDARQEGAQGSARSDADAIVPDATIRSLAELPGVIEGLGSPGKSV